MAQATHCWSNLKISTFLYKNTLNEITTFGIEIKNLKEQLSALDNGNQTNSDEINRLNEAILTKMRDKAAAETILQSAKKDADVALSGARELFTLLTSDGKSIRQFHPVTGVGDLHALFYGIRSLNKFDIVFAVGSSVDYSTFHNLQSECKSQFQFDLSCVDLYWAEKTETGNYMISTVAESEYTKFGYYLTGVRICLKKALAEVERLRSQIGRRDRKIERRDRKIERRDTRISNRDLLIGELRAQLELL